MKIFIDVDNTILEHSGFYSIETESRIHSSIGKFPIENQKAISIMYDSAICRNPNIVRRLFEMDDVFILTKYPAMEYEIHKQKRLAKILEITHNQLMSAKNSAGISKYIMVASQDSKVQVVKDLFKLDNLKDCVLIDDYSANLIEWTNNKGISIKYYNEYNSPNHPVKGLSISNFKIFETLLDNKCSNKLILSCEDTYMLSSFVKLLDSRYKIETLDILREVYYDLKKRFELDKVDINSKYNFRNFLIEYFFFLDNLNPVYWKEHLRSKLSYNKDISVVCSSFDLDYKKLDLFIDNDNIAIKIIEPGKDKARNIYDIYLTLDPNSFVNNIDYSLNNLISLLERFLFLK